MGPSTEGSVQGVLPTVQINSTLPFALFLMTIASAQARAKTASLAATELEPAQQSRHSSEIRDGQ